MRAGVITLLLLALLATTAGAEEAPPRFLGMAVCRSVTTGPDGLTELHGAHNAVWSTLPATEDLEVYTRWMGSGVHTVSVVVTSPTTGEKLAERSDEIDFGHDPVTFFTHDLAGTTFNAAGVYAVSVDLDGRNVAQYALYVDDAADLPMRPAFVLSVPASSGSTDTRGEARVTGIFEYFTFRSFPAADSFSFVTLWFSGAGSFTQRLQITDTDGRVLATSRATAFSATPGQMRVVVDSFDGVVFDSPGTYTATLFLDGVRVVSSPLVIGGG
ncbi:MAG TPA: hypothetical protein VHE79_03240 [Spirochaetia bacterium]